MMESLGIPPGTRCLYYSTSVLFIYFLVCSVGVRAISDVRWDVCHLLYFVLKCGSFFSCSYDEQLAHVHHGKLNTPPMLKCTFHLKKWQLKSIGSGYFVSFVFNCDEYKYLTFFCLRFRLKYS